MLQYLTTFMRETTNKALIFANYSARVNGKIETTIRAGQDHIFTVFLSDHRALITILTSRAFHASIHDKLPDLHVSLSTALFINLQRYTSTGGRLK